MKKCKGPKPKPFDANYVRDALERGDKLYEILAHLDMDYSTFRIKCKARGIVYAPRQLTYAKLDALKTVHFYEDWQLSVNDLAEETGIYPKMISEYLRDRGVNIRSGRAQKLIEDQREREYEAWLASVSDVKEYF